jgi:hypothetical protein
MEQNKIDRMARKLAECIVSALSVSKETIAECEEMARLYNEVYSLSSRACAECVHESAKQLAAARTAPGFETYTEIMNEARGMLARGDNQSDVVYHFEMKVAKEYGRAEDDK